MITILENIGRYLIVLIAVIAGLFLFSYINGQWCDDECKLSWKEFGFEEGYKIGYEKGMSDGEQYAIERMDQPKDTKLDISRLDQQAIQSFLGL